MRRLWFGGSFNPIHNGHLICARAAAESGGFDRVVLVPSSRPPHKPDSADLAAASGRLEMCRLAISHASLFEVDDLELRRDRPSYTLDTARILASRLPSERISWLIGADTLPQLLTWHEPDLLLKEVQFMVMARPGVVIDWHSLPASLQKLNGNLLTVPQIEISATMIRRRVAASQSIDFLTPGSVCRYIRDQKLYRPVPSAGP